MEHDTDLWMERDYRSLGIHTIDGFYTRRNLIMTAFCRATIMKREKTKARPSGSKYTVSPSPSGAIHSTRVKEGGYGEGLSLGKRKSSGFIDA